MFEDKSNHAGSRKQTIPYFERESGDPLFYLDDGELATGDGVTWPLVQQHVFDHPFPNAKINLAFLKKLYVTSKVDETIKELEDVEVDSSQALYVFASSADNAFELSDVESMYSKRAEVLEEFSEMVHSHQNKQSSLRKSEKWWNVTKNNFDHSDIAYSKVVYETQVDNSNGTITELMVFDSAELIDHRSGDGDLVQVVGCLYRNAVKFKEDDASRIEAFVMAHDHKSSEIKIVVVENQELKIVRVDVAKERLTFKFETQVAALLPNKSSTLKRIVTAIVENVAKLNRYKRPSFQKEKSFYHGSYNAQIVVSFAVLKDVVTNDPEVQKICYLNESNTINSKDSNVNMFVRKSFLTRYADSLTGDVSVGLFERPNKLETLVKFKKIPGGSNRDDISKLMVETINKVIQHVFDRTGYIASYYANYIDESILPRRVKTAPPPADVSANRPNLRAKAPDVFLANYTRLCSKPPVIVDGESRPADDNATMTFPVYGESEPKTYRCDNAKYRYPGLIKNLILENKVKFPYLPCCYQKPQTQSRNYMTYFNRQQRSAERINSDEIGKTTTKIVAPKRLGSLPPRIDKLLNYVTGIKFYRYGVAKSPSSCLTVMNMVTRRPEPDKRTRERLSEATGVDLRNPATYVDPVVFKSAIEDYYDVSYVLFSLADDDFAEIGQFTSLKRNVIFMVENSAFQHVELLVDENTIKYINKKFEAPIFLYDSSEDDVQKIVDQVRQRFDSAWYDNAESRIVVSRAKSTDQACGSKKDGGFLTIFREKKRLALYVMWCACRAYSIHARTTGAKQDEWIADQTTVIEGYDYRGVTIGPVYDVSELTTKEGRFIFDSFEMQKRVAFNLNLMFSEDLKRLNGNYHLFYKNRYDFDVRYPTGLALSKKEYFQRSRKPYKLNMLSNRNVRFLERNKLYFVENLFDVLRSVKCVFYASMDELVEASFSMLAAPLILNQTRVILTAFEPTSGGETLVSKYSLNGAGAVVDVLLIGNNKVPFYGLVVP